ncbi:UDP-2,4-diacetamido-2,4,6-trideoxy-beta-L-altropyranose hydrolase [Oscillatoria sp. FACHB-1407]|uniref:UDP-2,4-diacetamido-2,4, 6-trideoxy-beta-L-altropyranose hydrolase n=1 Tax=Oscillatoria sp. FACHB-1407 TaxID=2692847 RepID=UPI001689AE1C|nr:UDP-2,4-diacetamido-2,4,6-trideoxy-beta-L-altropyranose hydrolase [Oscillatoria sp. FACHB-1407]MBD2464236.1 UDP-2,4-diacetamido-2,4,6-trideoxy-beta-L-altropyranose hydrolase [Oscillatoria sp. FACHB-1407]
MVILIRADASTRIGTGHIMRCLALAQGLQSAGHHPIVVAAQITPNLVSRLQTLDIQLINIPHELGSLDDAQATIALAHHYQAIWINVDGYHFGADYQRWIKAAGLNLLFFDDYQHASHYDADLVLNQNVYACPELYESRESYTQLLLGTRYALLRPEFLQWQGWQRPSNTPACKILITMGGADPDNVTLKILRAIQLIEIEGLEIIAVIGGSNPHWESLQSVVQASQDSIHLKQNVTNMPELMAWADVAIAAGGTTSWELAFMGLPTLMVILAENQRAIAEKLGELGAVINLGWHGDVTIEAIAIALTDLLSNSAKRSDMMQRNQTLVDGRGVERVVQCLQLFPNK